MNKRELGAVLAALRYWQLSLTGESLRLGELEAIATNEGEHSALTADEIDVLCEKLNTEEPIKLLVEVFDGTATFASNHEGVQVLLADYDWPEDAWTHTLGESNEGFHLSDEVAAHQPELVKAFENAEAVR